MPNDETTRAIELANRVLDRISADPDDDLTVLARQFLRARESYSRIRQLAERGYAALEDWIYQYPDLYLKKEYADVLAALASLPPRQSVREALLAEPPFRLSVEQVRKATNACAGYTNFDSMLTDRLNALLAAAEPSSGTGEEK